MGQLNYRYVREGNVVFDAPYEQTDMSQLGGLTSVPLNQKWQAIAAYYYDLKQHRNIDRLVGLRYDSCCWSVDLVLEQENKPDNVTLTSSTGARVTDKDVITKPTLVYFGYAFCPDVCPTDLARNATAADILVERGIDVGLAFITIDPARDTPEVLREYASMIHPRLVGLTGTPEEIAAVASAYKVFYRKSGDDPENYLMDHSTFTYLMAPGSRFLEFYPSAASAETVADSVACFSAAA